MIVFYCKRELAYICDNSWSAYKEFDESLLRRYDVAQRINVMNFDDGKRMFSTDVEEGMRDKSEFLEKICVRIVVFSYND